MAATITSPAAWAVDIGGAKKPGERRGLPPRKPAVKGWVTICR